MSPCPRKLGMEARDFSRVRLHSGKYNPSLKLAMDIAKVFELTVEDIFFFED